MSDTKYCKDCKNMNCPENRVNCKYPDAIACDLYRDTPPTFFDRITQSREALAEKLVYQFIAYDRHGLFVSCWRSVLTGDIEYYKESEAISATMEKLKEVVDV